MKKTYQKLKLTFGLITSSISIFLFLSFNSYWKNGISDQSAIIGLSNDYVNTENLLGGIGAEVSEFLIRIFGVSSYLLTLITLLLAIKLLFGIKRIHLIKLSIQHMFWIMWASLVLATMTKNTLSGKLGLTIFETLILLIGKTI